MTTMVAKVLPNNRRNLKDRLSRLTFLEACKLLGPNGKELIQKNANAWEFEIPKDAYIGPDLFRLRFPEEKSSGKPVIVTLTLLAEARHRIHFRCNQCAGACEHVGAAFSLILEEKSALGLAAPPAERPPVESLSEEALVTRAFEERRERAKIEKMTIRALDPKRVWSDYIVTNRLSGKSYRVALRGVDPGNSYCSCPDFRTNTLGTCKHVLKVIEKAKRSFDATAFRRKYRPKCLAFHLEYLGEVKLKLQVPDKLDDAVDRVIRPIRDKAIEDIPGLLKCLGQLQKLGQEVVVYPDAEEFIDQRMSQARLRRTTDAVRTNPAQHPLGMDLLNVPLLPYQLDGIAFAAGAGRAILADDMGLGKTMQGIGTAELLAREVGIRKVLVICPASLKSQWRSEIHRFCDRDVQLIGGAAAERTKEYGNDVFFTVCNYEQVLRDILAIERNAWDLIILDEGQRIKNWESKTSQVVKSLRSRFALVLTGTPLENRLDDLFSIVQFVDDRRLGPGFRFFNKHRIVDEKGKVLGYKDLADLRETLKPILLRRTRESVALELPSRTTEIVRITPTDEQLVLHNSHMQIVAAITRKPFISEMDLLRLQKSLLMCRMAANSTFLVEKESPGHSTKLERLDELFEQIFAEKNRKVVLFSEWTTMLDLIEPLLRKRTLAFVRLDGKVPQKKRQELVHRFQTDPECRLFLTTNAGSTGLNLQAANTVVNVDLPWNPAVLEQRIARAYRMGQKNPVQVFVLITEGTIEESLLSTLAAKKDLALAALDIESELDQVEMTSGIQELKSRLEILLGAHAEAPVDETTRIDAENRSAQPVVQRERIAAAGGELIGAAFKFLGEIVAGQSLEPSAEVVANLKGGLSACIEQTPDGTSRLSIPLPDPNALQQFAETLARLLSLKQ